MPFFNKNNPVYATVLPSIAILWPLYCSLSLIYIIIIFHCLMSDTDLTGPRRLLRHRGKNL